MGAPVGHAAPFGDYVFTLTLALTNFGAKPVEATVTNAVTTGHHPDGKKVGAGTVAARSSLTVPLVNLAGDSQTRNSFMVQSDASPGNLHAGMTVFAGTSFQSVQMLRKDSSELHNGGAHPWTTAGGANSTLLLFNYSSKPQKFFVAIAPGGMLWQQTYELAALETKALDIGALVAARTKDDTGQIVPASASAGVVTWFTTSFSQGAGRLLVRQADIGLARSFSCQTVNDLCGSSSMQNNNVSIAAGGTGSIGPYQVDMCITYVGQCGGSYSQTTSGWQASWSSSNTNVATIQQNQGAVATIAGNTAGSASITATGIPITQTGLEQHLVLLSSATKPVYGTMLFPAWTPVMRMLGYWRDLRIARRFRQSTLKPYTTTEMHIGCLMMGWWEPWNDPSGKRDRSV